MIKRSVIKAAVALLVIGGGTGLVVGFNPFSNNKLEETNNSKHKIEEKSKKDNTKEDIEIDEPVIEENSSNEITVSNAIDKKTTPSQENKAITITANLNTQSSSDTYSKALAAVELAESIIDDSSYNNAYDLVNKVEDETRSIELKNRLEVIKNEIEVKLIVSNLENQINSANSLEDINIARNYNNEQNIAQRIQSLTNTELKNKLNESINKLNRILNDTTPATVNIENNEVFKTKEVTIFDYNNYFAALKNLKTNEVIKIDNGYEAQEEGKFELTVIDAAFNIVTKTFSIDQTKPTFNVDNNGYYSTENMDLKVIDENPDKLIITFKDETLELNEETFNEEGEYQLKAIDKAGNESENIKITIDNTKPVIEIIGNLEDNLYIDEVKYIITEDNIDTIIIDNEEIEDITSLRGNIKESGKHTIAVTDKAGNSVSKTFEIKISSNNELKEQLENKFIKALPTSAF